MPSTSPTDILEIVNNNCCLEAAYLTKSKTYTKEVNIIMPRGSDAKLRRRNRKKEEESAVTDMFGAGDGEENGGFTEEIPLPPGVSNGATVEEDSEGESPSDMPKKKKKKKKKSDAGDLPPQLAQKKEKGIKTLPLILLILMTGSTLLPAMIYAGDYMSTFLAKNNLMGAVGFRLGIGSVPKKRVLSFYEKHAPEKLNDVPGILSKHYGDYPKLIKKLERKYQDYGYFLGWEEDEAPSRLIQDYFSDIYGVWIKQWNKHATQVAKTAARNVRYNLYSLYKKGYKIWKKTAWPLLEPIFGVPDGAEKQKRQDAAEARKRREASAKSSSSSKARRKNREFRDDVEE